MLTVRKICDVSSYHSEKETRLRAVDRASLEAWYAARGSRDVRVDFGQPLPALPIPGHANCRVPGCVGYTRRGTACADHFPRSVS